LSSIIDKRRESIKESSSQFMMQGSQFMMQSSQFKDNSLIIPEIEEEEELIQIKNEPNQTNKFESFQETEKITKKTKKMKKFTEFITIDDNQEIVTFTQQDMGKTYNQFPNRFSVLPSKTKQPSSYFPGENTIYSNPVATNTIVPGSTSGSSPLKRSSGSFCSSTLPSEIKASIKPIGKWSTSEHCLDFLIIDSYHWNLQCICS